MSEMMQVPDGWEAKPLKSIGTCKSGLTYSPDDIVENGGLLVLRSSNIQNSQIALEDNVFVREDIKVNYKVQENDILVCVRNGSKNLIGKNALITKEVEDMAHGAFMTVFHSKINEYVFQIFQSDLFFKRVEKNLGATINSINNSDLLLFEFPFPKEKKEQEKIAKILSTLDEAIESTNRLIKKEKNIKIALMQELLTNGIDLSGQIRSPKTHTYKQSELGLIPDEWEVVSLIDVTDKNDRYSFTGGPFGSDLKSSDYVDQGVRVIQLQNIGDGEFKNNDFVYTSKQKAQELFSCQISPNEIIMSKMGDPVGRACLIPNIEEKFVMCSDGIRIKVDLNKYDNYFIFLAINNTDFRNSIERVALGSTRKRVGLVELKTLKLKMPRHEEQKQISKILTTQDKKIQTEETNLAKLKELKKGLMHDLLSGKVRVK